MVIVVTRTVDTRTFAVRAAPANAAIAGNYTAAIINILSRTAVWARALI